MCRGPSALQVKMLIEGDHRIIAAAGCLKTTNAGVVGVKEHPWCKANHPGRPDINDTTVAGHGDAFALVVGKICSRLATTVVTKRGKSMSSISPRISFSQRG